MLIRSFLSKLLNLMKSSRVAFAISLFFSVSSIDLFSMARNQSFKAVHTAYNEKRKLTHPTLFGDSNTKPGPLFGDNLNKVRASVGDNKLKQYGPLFGEDLIPVVGGGTTSLRRSRVA